jgi:chemotaxis protein methyltransferase CheR
VAISSQTFQYFRELVLARSAIILDLGKEYLVESRLTPVARANGFPSVDELAAVLAKADFNSMHRQAVEAMTTNETSFFRDAHPFEMLRQTIIPRIMARRAADRRLSFWCAAASTGQEPYSVAMLLRENFPELRTWRVDFLATDLSAAVLAKARSGRFTQLEANRGLPAPLLLKYFTKIGTEWQVNDDLRSMIDYRELNLIERWPSMPPIDVVFMRNVLIYFDVPTKREILRNVRSVMSPHGHLLLGGAETTMGIDDQFEREQIGRGSAYRLMSATRRATSTRAA